MVRNRLLRVSVAIALPVAVALVAVYLLRPAPGKAYEKCRAALHGRLADSALAGQLLRTFNQVATYQTTEFNINDRYTPGKVNLLLPVQDEEDWPEELCGMPAEPANCAARSQDSTILCNPAFARQVLSPRAYPGPWTPEAYLAARYLVLSILGHELAHLGQTATSGPRHAHRRTSPNGLACYRPERNDSTDEERADVRGMYAACEVVRRDPLVSHLPDQPEEVLDVLSQVRNDLDEEYFAVEDACTGDRLYPSVSRRKYRFSRGFLTCLYSDTNNMVLQLADAEEAAFHATEAILRERQLIGHAASADYGRAKLYDHTVVEAGTAGPLLTFDATGTSSTLWLVRNRGQERLDFEPLRRWPKVGRVLHASTAAQKTSLLVRHADTLTQLVVGCDGKARRPRCTITARARAIPSETEVTSGPDGSLLLRTPERALRYDTSEDFFRGKPSAETVYSSEDVALTAVRSGLAAIFRMHDQGLYAGELLAGGSPSFFALALPEGETGCLQAPTFVDDRLLFLLRRANSPRVANCDAGYLPGLDAIFGGSDLALWDCPVGVLTTAQPAACTVYPAPPETTRYIPSGSLDLAALLQIRIEPLPGLRDGVAVYNFGSAWILDRKGRRQDAVPARGIVRADPQAGSLISYRARIVDHLRLNLRPAHPEVRYASATSALQ